MFAGAVCKIGRLILYTNRLCDFRTLYAENINAILIETYYTKGKGE